MQSRPTEASQESSLAELVSESHFRQHGLDYHADEPFHPLSEGERWEDSQSSSSGSDAIASSPSGEGLIWEASQRRLSPDASPKLKSSLDRVSQHERAAVSFPRRHHRGPGFKVVAKARQDTVATRAIFDFPNEVLTHILSHLPPQSLSTVSLVSRRFHGLVTTPHAWRIAFCRYFPGADAFKLADTITEAVDDDQESTISEKRVFTRLTTLASWRSEYILRTRLIRSLERGKPAQFELPNSSGSYRSGSGHGGNAQITYNSNLTTTVNHLNASFGTHLNRKLPRFIHGADDTGYASSSDPSNAKVDQWGFSDPHGFVQFSDLFPGDAEYGLGAGNIVGVPNSMDVSQQFGLVYAEGFPGGSVYYRSVEEQRGRQLGFSQPQALPESGIPFMDRAGESMCSVWITKEANIPSMTEGLIGMLSGSSYGVVTSYSLGTNTLNSRRFERGETTARWILSPGVPIVSISVDDCFSAERLSKQRIWAVALNALGEVFYATALPSRRVIGRGIKLKEQNIDEIAWETGRTIHWALVESTRRAAKPDPFETSTIDGSYSPRSSWNGMGLSKQQIVAETREIESFLRQKPKHYRAACEGWDMRQTLKVDFAGGDENGAGENMFVCHPGSEDGQQAYIKRLTRWNVQKRAEIGLSSLPTKSAEGRGLISGTVTGFSEDISWSFDRHISRQQDSAHQMDFDISMDTLEEWRTSNFAFGDRRGIQVTVTAIDMSTFALLAVSEDPLLNIGMSSATSSPLSSPLGQMPLPTSSSDVPGQRARFLAAGTRTGSVFVWNMRAGQSKTPDLANTVQPIRIIHTESPRISCLALSALYLVHGGNDGLVQAWDPLASTCQPIRTLNSRFSSRARRRLVQAESSIYGVGINLFAAGAICVDPDPTVLRGMVSIGTHLRYWSYSSSAADQYKGNKRRPRRSERGSNQGGEKYGVTGRGVLKDYIANERLELEREKQSKRKEQERLAGRFGLDLLGPGASENEILAYATLLSEEAAQSDEARRRSEINEREDTQNVDANDQPTKASAAQHALDSEVIDPDVAKAIRLSLLETDETSSPIPFKYAKGFRPSSGSPPWAGRSVGSSRPPEVDDLDFALQLSLAEEKSRQALDDDFPLLSSSPSPPASRKGKEKRRKS